MTPERSAQLLAVNERGGWLIREKYLLELIPPTTKVASNQTGIMGTHAAALEENDRALAANEKELAALALDS